MPAKKPSADHPPGLSVIPPEQLFFDGENPRLVECGATATTPQSELLEILWKEMAVDEVAMSIAVEGYWDFEPMIGVSSGDGVIVIEGNRRLAAVRLLLDPALRRQLRATDLPAASPKVTADLRKGVPVNIVQNRRDAWRYLGFKHVNGPAKWNSYAKAQYISQIEKGTVRRN